MNNTLCFPRAWAFLALVSLAAAAVTGCSGSSSTPRADAGVSSEPGSVIAAERLRHAAPGRMILEPVEGAIDTVRFHIGSPLFLRLTVGSETACTPGVGEFFHFDRTGTQLGWSFTEVHDSLLFPPVAGRCERILMLSSEASNRLAEGYFTMRSEIFLDAKNRLRSDTIDLRPVRSTTGADETSYARFLMEQIIRNPSHLRDPQTLAALFGEGVPTSAESEIYRAVILYRSGDLAGAAASLRASQEIERERRRVVNLAAARTRETLERHLGPSATNR